MVVDDEVRRMQQGPWEADPWRSGWVVVTAKELVHGEEASLLQAANSTGDSEPATKDKRSLLQGRESREEDSCP